QIKGLVGAELRPEIDLAQVRTDLANAQASQISAQGNLDIGQAVLDQAMGEPTQTKWTLTDDALAPLVDEERPRELLIEEALRNRPEWAALEKQKQSQEATLSAIVGGFGPSLVANASGTVAGTRFDQPIPNWAVGVALNWQILQG